LLYPQVSMEKDSICTNWRELLLVALCCIASWNARRAYMDCPSSPL
jgi:hypothetical protein